MDSKLEWKQSLLQYCLDFLSLQVRRWSSHSILSITFTQTQSFSSWNTTGISSFQRAISQCSTGHLLPNADAPSIRKASPDPTGIKPSHHWWQWIIIDDDKLIMERFDHYVGWWLTSLFLTSLFLSLSLCFNRSSHHFMLRSTSVQPTNEIVCNLSQGSSNM